MRRSTRATLALATLAGLAGCGNGPPGGGITNGSAPSASVDSPARRTDEPERSRAVPGGLTQDGGSSSGSGGKGGGVGGVEPAKDPGVRTGDARKDTVTAVGSAGAQPTATDSPGSAAGATKPAGDIKVGTPKGPQ